MLTKITQDTTKFCSFCSMQTYADKIYDLRLKGGGNVHICEKCLRQLIQEAERENNNTEIQV